MDNVKTKKIAIVYSAIYYRKPCIITYCCFSLVGIWFNAAHSACHFVQIVQVFLTKQMIRKQALEIPQGFKADEVP